MIDDNGREVRAMLELNEVLVPVDFSPASRAVLARALTIVNGDEPVVIVHHVLDPSLAEFAEAHGMGGRDEVLSRMRQQAEQDLEALRPSVEGTGIELQPLVSEGVPFYEIIRKAEEFDVDAVIMGKRGVRDHPEGLFFGSTAERVIRGAKQLVLVFPGED